MTVQELIDALGECDHQAQVYHQSTGGIIDEVVVVQVIGPDDREGKYMHIGSVYLT